MHNPLSLQVKQKKGLAHIMELVYALGQFLTVPSSPNQGPGRVGKMFFKFPIYLYKVGLGGLIGSKLLLLTTVGRKSGRYRTTPLGYITGEEGVFYITAGWRGSSNWYRNVKTNPEVQVRAGSIIFHCQAEELKIEDQVRVLANFSKLYPIVIRTYKRMTRMSFDGSDDFFRRIAEEGPMLVLRE